MQRFRFRGRRALLSALFLTVLLPVAASGTTGLERAGALTLEAGEDSLGSAVIDPDGTHAYFGTGTGRVVKVNLATMTQVDALSLDAGEVGLVSAVIDPDGTHAYFGTQTSPGQVVKVDLATMTQVGALTLGTGEDNLRSAVMDPDGTHAYFGTVDNTEPGRVVKVNLATMTRVDAVTLDAGEDSLVSAVIDPDGTHAYFGTVTGRVVKVELAGGMTRVGALTLPAGEDSLISAVIDPDGTHAYFGTFTEPGRVVKVELAGGMTRVGALSLDSGEDRLRSAVIDPDGTHAYFGTVTGRVVKVGLPVAVADARSEPSPADRGVAIAVEQAANVTGAGAVLVRDGAVVPMTTTFASGVGPRGGAVIEAEGMRITLDGGLGATESAGLLVAPDGEIVCEVCAMLAADSIVEAWIYSTPRLAAAVRVEVDTTSGECPVLRIPVGSPLDGGDGIAAGAHTLQLRMFTDEGFEVVATGITVGGPVPASIPAGEGPVRTSAALLVLGLLGAVAAIRGVQRRPAVDVG